MPQRLGFEGCGHVYGCSVEHSAGRSVASTFRGIGGQGDNRHGAAMKELGGDAPRNIIMNRHRSARHADEIELASLKPFKDYCSWVAPFDATRHLHPGARQRL